jgi:hypothetical protein
MQGQTLRTFHPRSEGLTSLGRSGARQGVIEASRIMLFAFTCTHLVPCENWATEYLIGHLGFSCSASRIVDVILKRSSDDGPACRTAKDSYARVYLPLRFHRTHENSASGSLP